MRNSLQGIRNLIFDLGGVIINLDMDRTHQAFLHLAGGGAVPTFSLSVQDEVFKQFEVGSIDTPTFLNRLRELIGPYTDEQLITAWNAMLLDIPTERIELLKRLKTRYRTFLFSNTNAVHYDGFNKILWEAHGLKGLEPLFEKVYFSHTLGKRKPEVDSFEQIILENGLNPEETLFLDDTPGHLVGAEAAGLKTMLVNNEIDIMRIFSETATA